jgi:SAM-dependent methyltransferase
MPTNTTHKFYKAPRYLFRKLNILRMVKKLDAKTFLDVGCGAGELACSLAEAGMKGVAVDFSEDAIEVANGIRKQRGLTTKQLSFKLGGLENVKGQKFDLVSCYEVLEHIKDDEGLLKELVGHSNKYVLISVPAKQKLFDASDEAVGHFRRYEKQNLIKMLEGQNLKIVEFVNYGYPFTDAVRVGRKAFFKMKLRKDGGASMKNRSKESGINPIKIPAKLTKVDLEKPLLPLYHASRLFNGFNLSEGYLVLCQKKK